MDSTVMVGSVTYAMKARDILQSLGYKTSIERKTKEYKAGCGYGVITNCERETLQNILRENNVKYTKII